MERNVRNYAAALASLLNAHPEVLPYGSEVEAVQVLAGRERQSARQRRADASKPSERGDSIYIVLRPRRAGASPTEPKAEVGEAVLGELVRALRDAEQAPGHSFVALKWFRDSYLPQRGFSWAQSAEHRNQALREATARGWVRVEKIANPRNPGFPTSVLHAAVEHPGLRELLGEAPKLGWDFKPIQMKGEPMSATVRKMRDGGY